MSIPLKQSARIACLKLLQATGRDIRIRHHWVPGQKLTIHSFKHKGYWWHGKRRETQTLTSVAKLLGPGQIALDVGAHVGYFSTYFAYLVGPGGRVIAFEPSDENLRYTRANVGSLDNVQLETHGISNFTGDASFYVESLTGQNNSLVENYQVFEDNATRAGFACERRKVTIKVTTIDEVCRRLKITPHFIKMDIEGAELEALQGMSETLRFARPVVLLEVSRQHVECLEIFKIAGYHALDDALRPVDDSAFCNGEQWAGPRNFFFAPSNSLSL